MRDYRLFLIGLLPISILCYYPGFEYVVVPGWHTVIFSSRSVVTVLILAFLLATLLIYLWLFRTKRKTNKYLTIIHFIFSFLPLYSLTLQMPLINYVLEQKCLYQYLLVVNILYLLFVIGQFLFIINLGVALLTPKIGVSK